MSSIPHETSLSTALDISDDRMLDLTAVLARATSSSAGPAVSDSLRYLETVEDLADIERLFLAYQVGKIAEKINRAMPVLSAVSQATSEIPRTSAAVTVTTVHDSLGIPTERWRDAFGEVKAHGLADPDETVRWIRDHPVFTDSEKMALTVAIVRMRDLGFWEEN